MTDAAANALLKTLEEPPAETCSFLESVSLNVYGNITSRWRWITLRRRRNSTP
ncbi:hypothetical protein ACNKHS_06510 [Shigella flexneri]